MKKRTLSLLFVLLLVLSAGVTAAPQVPRQGQNVALLGQIGGEARAVAVQGSYAYAGIGPRLVIFDLSDPAQPLFVGQTAVLRNLVRDVALAGDYAYAVSTENGGGLHIIDVSDPAAPFQAGFYAMPEFAWDVATAGSYAYVANGDYGLRIVDVSDPAAPFEAGFYDTPDYARGVALAGGYAYVADSGAGLRVVDVSNPAAPHEVGSCDTPGGGAEDIAVAGDYAYIANGGAGLRIIDVSDPAAPHAVGLYDTPGTVVDVALAGGYAYVADEASGLRIVDVSDPSAPFEAGFYDTPGYIMAAAVHSAHSTGVPGLASLALLLDGRAGGYAYLADANYGLRTVDVSDPAAPAETAFYAARPAGDLAFHSAPLRDGIAGGYAYATFGDLGLQIVDVSDPAAPFEAGFYDMPSWLGGVATAGGYAYVAADTGLRIFDVSDPAAPVEVGFCSGPGSATDVAFHSAPLRDGMAGGYAYVTYVNEGLQIVDISDPAAPFEVGFFGLPGGVWAVAVAGGYAYVGRSGGLHIVDVSDPAAPFQTGVYVTPSPWASYDVAVAGGYAYLADSSFWHGNCYGGALRIVDVSNPTAPFEAGIFETPECGRGVAFHSAHSTGVPGLASLASERDGMAGRYAYLVEAWHYSRLHVVDVSNPNAPFEVGFRDTPGTALQVAVANGNAYVADYGGGLQILRFETYSVSGRVTDAADQGIPGVVVSAGPGASAVTDGGGDYIISGLISGTYTLTPAPICYSLSPVTRTVTVPPDAAGQDFHAEPVDCSRLYLPLIAR
jgi:hypothetical protein